VALCLILMLLGVESPITPTPSFAQGTAVAVGGPAGPEVDVWFDGTYWARNRSARKVIVKLGTWSVLLNPGQTHMFSWNGKPLISYTGATEADYK
jgi:hypothetical protein